MTGRYKIFINSQNSHWRYRPEEDRRWFVFVSLCRSLARDGLNYEVELHVADETPHILVRANGTGSRRRSKPVTKAVAPPILTQEQCARRLGEAGKILRHIRSQMRDNLTRRSYARRWRYEHCGQEAVTQRKRLGGWLAKRLAVYPSSGVTNQDYRDLDQVVGHRVRRLSQIPERYRPDSIKEYVLKELLHVGTGYKRTGDDAPSPFPFAEYQTALADVAYWREMEALSGQRQHFKPGRNDDNQYADDEVAAVA